MFTGTLADNSLKLSFVCFFFGFNSLKSWGAMSRKTIYTANPIAGMHPQLRKITKSKGAFSPEQALMKLMFLIIRGIFKR
jgi:transposase-like protein